MNIIGQNNLLNIIDNITIDTLPKTLLIQGPFGSGKHMFSEYIAEKLNLTINDITDTICLDLITEITINPVPGIYRLNLNELTEKQNNSLLKFLEEPPTNCFIILLAENLSDIIPTIINRCQIWKIDNYTKEDLSHFTSNDLVLEIANTPGDVKLLLDYNLNEMINLADSIIINIANASYPNTLVLSDKIAYTKDDKGYNLRLFVKILLKELDKKYQQFNSLNLMKAYKLTLILLNQLKTTTYNQKYLYEYYLFKLKGVLKNAN